jgi:hypothetical protein
MTMRVLAVRSSPTFGAATLPEVFMKLKRREFLMHCRDSIEHNATVSVDSMFL